jgi:hypothetical protein
MTGPRPADDAGQKRTRADSGNAGCRNEGPKHRLQAEPHGPSDLCPIAEDLSNATGNYAHSRRRTVACEFKATCFLEASASLGSRAEGDRGANCKTTDVCFRVTPPNVGSPKEPRGGAKTRRQINHPKSRILPPTQIPTTLSLRPPSFATAASRSWVSFDYSILPGQKTDSRRRIIAGSRSNAQMHFAPSALLSIMMVSWREASAS